MAGQIEHARFRIRVARSPAAKHVSKPKDAPKSKQMTVSASGLFRKKPAKIKTKDANRGKGRKASLPEHDETGLEDAAIGIHSETKASYAEIYDTFTKRLVQTNLSSSLFQDTISSAAAELREPLVNDEIRTTTKRPDGTRKITVSKIGDRISLFKELVEKEGANLEKYWKEWESLQQEIDDFGTGVLGSRTSSVDLEGTGGQKSFKKEMELIKVADDTMMDELTEAIDKMATKAIEKMKTSEKELDVVIKQRRAELYTSLIEI